MAGVWQGLLPGPEQVLHIHRQTARPASLQLLWLRLLLQVRLCEGVRPGLRQRGLQAQGGAQA